MIVSADRMFFSPERFAPTELKPGKTCMEIDSNMGGSFTVLFKRIGPDGRLVFAYDRKDELAGREISFADAQRAAAVLYCLYPGYPYEFSRLREPYGIRESTHLFGVGQQVDEAFQCMLRDKQEVMVVSHVTYRNAKPTRIVLVATDHPTDPVQLAALKQEIVRLVRAISLCDGDKLAFETLTKSQWEKRAQSLPPEQLPRPVQLPAGAVATLPSPMPALPVAGRKPTAAPQANKPVKGSR